MHMRMSMRLQSQIQDNYIRSSFFLNKRGYIRDQMDSLTTTFRVFWKSKISLWVLVFQDLEAVLKLNTNILFMILQSDF